MHLRKHAHGLVDDHLAANNKEEEEIEYSCFSRMSQNDGNVDIAKERLEGDEEDKSDGDSNSSVSDGSVDSDFKACF